MNKIVPYLSVVAAGAAVAYLTSYTLMRWEIDSLRADALRSAAREAEHDKQIAAALDISRQIEAVAWQVSAATASCSAAKNAVQELLEMVQKRLAQPARPAPKASPVLPSKAQGPAEKPQMDEPSAPAPAPAPAKPVAPKKDEAVAGGADPAAMVAAHNRWRSEVGVPGLKWSDELADVAQGWADRLAGENCAMYHSGNGYGENIYQASALMWPDGRREFRAVLPSRPVDAWGEEKRWYNAGTGDCSATGKDTCGHYTQVVWKGTAEVGCGMAVCGNKGQIWVCNYSPAGNIGGKKPF